MVMILVHHLYKIKIFQKKTFEAAIVSSNTKSSNIHDAVIAQKKLEYLLSRNETTAPEYSGDVALRINLQTRYVTPQFHIIFDDSFTTIPYLNEEVSPPNWGNLVILKISYLQRKKISHLIYHL